MYTCACSAGFTGTPCAGKLSSQSRLHTNTYYMKQLLFFIKIQCLLCFLSSNSTHVFASPNQQWKIVTNGLNMYTCACSAGFSLSSDIRAKFKFHAIFQSQSRCDIQATPIVHELKRLTNFQSNRYNESFKREIFSQHQIQLTVFASWHRYRRMCFQSTCLVNEDCTNGLNLVFEACSSSIYSDILR